MRNSALASSAKGNVLWLAFAPDTRKSSLRVYPPSSILIQPELFVMKLSPCAPTSGEITGGSRVPGSVRGPGNGSHALRPSCFHTLYEHQECQKKIEYAHQSQYRTPVDIHACYLRYFFFYFLYHGSTSLLFVIPKCPYATKKPLSIVLVVPYRKNKTTGKP
jgi:hypothetical protein